MAEQWVHIPYAAGSTPAFATIRLQSINSDAAAL